MEKIPHTSYVSILLHLKFGGFGYGIGRKYWPIRVSVLVSDLIQNSGFGHLLPWLDQGQLSFSHFLSIKNMYLYSYQTYLTGCAPEIPAFLPGK